MNVSPEALPDVRFLSERTVSTRLGVSQPTMRRWRRAGIGPEWVRLGPARVGYAAAALTAWLAAQTRGAHAA